MEGKGGDSYTLLAKCLKYRSIFSKRNGAFKNHFPHKAMDAGTSCENFNKNITVWFVEFS